MAIILFLHSCNKDPELINEYGDLPAEVATAARWFDGTVDQGKFIGPDHLNWKEASIGKDIKGQSLITLQIYQGSNSNGQDSTRQLLIVKSKQGVLKGYIRHISAQNEHIADAATYSLYGRKLNEGVWFVKSAKYSLLKVYGGEKRFVLMGWEEVPFDPFTHPQEEIGPATDMYFPGGIPNTEAYNCHYYAWGPSSGIPQDLGYVPGFPKWNDYPNPEANGYSPVSSGTPSKVGDRVIYNQDTGNGYDYPLHSGIVTGVDEQGRVTEVTSKWGKGPLVKHHPADSPYGDNRKYYSNN